MTALLEVPRQVAESALSVFGVRTGTEEPPYTATPLGDGVEIREYRERIAAETTVTAGEDAARSTGFRRLAGYIFGSNRGSAKIAMTAPVAQAPDPKGDWVIRFYMPSKWAMGELPTPNDDRVRLVTVPAETVAVLRFSGDRSAQAVAERTEQIRKVLRDKGFDATGEAVAWFYDPPWTLPFLRRNEVAIALTAAPRDSPRTV
ncbi:SOUL family heme-binding protein [Mycolicibacterium madagascariense]|nr:heme-binding protein [Mycolicibacterium madagascariense]MCV7015502.1 heme-binding protein [Mycolicibacterium madagascariense]